MRAPRLGRAAAAPARRRRGRRRAPARRRCAPRASRAGARGRARATRASPCNRRRARRARPPRAPRGRARRDRRAARRAAAAAACAASAFASDSRRRCPCDKPAVRDVRDALQADPFERGVGVGRVVTGRPRDEAHVLGDGEVVVTEGLVPDERDRAAHAPRFDRQVDTEHFSLSRAQRQQARAQPQQRGLARAVRPAQQQRPRRSSTSRSAPASAGNRPSMQTADRRRTQRNQSSGDRGCGTAKAYGGGRRTRRTGPTTAGERTDHGRYDRRRATCDRGHRPDAGDPRAPDPAVRRVPALGHRHLHRARPGEPQERVPAAARSSTTRTTPSSTGADDREEARSTADDHHDDDPVTTRRRRLRRRPRPTARSRASITIPKIGLELGYSSRARRATTSKKGPGHYPGTPLPGNDRQRRDRRAPHHVPAPVLATSTSCKPGDDIIIQTRRGHVRLPDVRSS